MRPKRSQDSEEATVSDDELRERRLRDPEVQARVREILEEMKRGDPVRPGITAEELPDFLREHG